MVKLSAPVAVCGMIFFGTACSLLAKLIYSVRAPNSYGEVLPYEKPWFQVLAMFAGMSVCILLDLPKPSSRRRSSDEEAPLLNQQHPSHTLPDGTDSHSVWIIGIPTLFDLFATACGCTGLLYTTVSVYQMLRGAMLVWTAFLSIIFLRRKLTIFNYAGILLCVTGIVLVGLANVWAEDNPRSRSDTIFGIAVILLGQVLQAAQVVMEEFLLQDLHMSSVRVVAWEGVFGILHCLLWVFPILYFLPGRDHGHLEDTGDAFYMLTHSWAVAGIILIDMTMMLFYNVCGMEVTDSLNAVHRVVIETLRTLCVWLVDLLIFYVLTDGDLGESWTPYSYLQLFGFTLLVLGTVLYNWENLLADYYKRQKQAAADVPLVDPTTPAAHEVEVYDAVQTPEMPDKPDRPVTKPVAVGVEDGYDEEEDEEQAGSYYGHTLGSVAHSPFLVAASGTPSSLAGSLRHRSGFHAGSH